MARIDLHKSPFRWWVFCSDRARTSTWMILISDDDNDCCESGRTKTTSTNRRKLVRHKYCHFEWTRGGLLMDRPVERTEQGRRKEGTSERVFARPKMGQWIRWNSSPNHSVDGYCGIHPRLLYNLWPTLSVCVSLLALRDDLVFVYEFHIKNVQPPHVHISHRGFIARPESVINVHDGKSDDTV